MNAETIIKHATSAKSMLLNLSAANRQKALGELIQTLEADRSNILAMNQVDINRAGSRMTDAAVDRMVLTDTRFDDMIESVKQVAQLPDIVGKIYGKKQQASGIVTSKMRIPIGVILMVYESRPNVTIDAVALAVKTGNAIILKGGSEIKDTNKVLGRAISKALKIAGLPQGTVSVLSDDSRSLTAQLLTRDDSIDLVIPRGSHRLLEFVQQNSRIPTLLHLEGNCHVYIDKKADPYMAINIVLDAKTQRFGTCNTAESLLIHGDAIESMLPSIVQQLIERGVSIRGDKTICRLVQEVERATERDWSEEYLAPIISIKVVDSLEEAIKHINKYGSGHTDTIVTEDSGAANTFMRTVDSSSVMHNTSTRLADGFEYGLGAEIGISTGKLHARGPVGQDGLTTYKWIVESNGIIKGDIVHIR